MGLQAVWKIALFNFHIPSFARPPFRYTPDLADLLSSLVSLLVLRPQKSTL